MGSKHSTQQTIQDVPLQVAVFRLSSSYADANAQDQWFDTVDMYHHVKLPDVASKIKSNFVNFNDQNLLNLSSGGRMGLRYYAVEHLKNTHGLVFVVDPSCSAEINQSMHPIREVLDSMSYDSDPKTTKINKKLPFLVIFKEKNKETTNQTATTPSPLPPKPILDKEAIIKSLGLKAQESIITWRVQDATTLFDANNVDEDAAISQGIHWLSEQLGDQFAQTLASLAIVNDSAQADASNSDQPAQQQQESSPLPPQEQPQDTKQQLATENNNKKKLNNKLKKTSFRWWWSSSVASPSSTTPVSA